MVKTDCRHFKGDIPCTPHKKFGVHCDNCEHYEKTTEKILIIKLGAIGDVIRTTPLLKRLKEVNPAAQIHWLTYTPEILPNSWVDKPLSVSIENLELIKNINYDWLINLDKDSLAVSLTNSIHSKKKTGFTIDEFGKARPFGSKPETDKWLTGLFDDLNKHNTMHYVQEIFEICGFTFNNEEYLIDIPQQKLNFDIDHSKKIVGLNTGCGGRWISRLWPENYWVELAKSLLANKYEVILLGGEQEHAKNLRIQKQSGTKYFGHYPLSDFINLIGECDIVVTAVTMAMHLAIALKKRLVLFNNIFNKNEFFLYNRGIILEPDFDCNCYFSPTCENNCMQYLRPETVFQEIKKL